MDVSFLAALPAALRFFTRLPVPKLPFEASPGGPPDLERMTPVLPVVGAVVGLIGSIVLLIGLTGLGGFVAATLAVGAMAAVTGAFHEDGLADTADGLGGMNPARRLEIMKDSRVGTFGAVALILSFALRIGALDGIAAAGGWRAAAALVAAAAVGRLAGAWILHALPPARRDGLGESAGRPSRAAIVSGGAIGFLIAAVLVIPCFGVPALAVACAASALAAYGIERLAVAAFGGQTGDVAGAAVQVSEIAFLLALLIFARHF